MKQSVEMAGED